MIQTQPTPASPAVRSAPLVRDIMTREVHTLNLDDSVQAAAKLFEQKRFHHVVVMEKHKVFGVVSDRDILKAVSPFIGNPTLERSQDRSTLKRRIHQIMTRKPVTIGPDEPVTAAAQRVLSEHVSCLPVVDAAGAVLGIVTIRDLVQQLVPRERPG